MNPYMHDPDSEITPGLLKRRVKFIMRWIGLYDTKSFHLDIGDRNIIAENLLAFTNTKGDLNSISWEPLFPDRYDPITCFEVIEHLQNPLLFLERLKRFTAPGGVLYLTTPRATFRFLKMDVHFHEFTKRDLLNLLDMAGWEIIEIGLTKSGYPWWLPFRTPGFRPLCRALFQWSFYVKAKIKESQ